MSKWLNKEYTIKRKLWETLLDAFLGAILCSIVFYCCVSSKDIMEALNVIKTNNIEFEVTKWMFFIFLIFLVTYKVSVFLINYDDSTPVKKKKKK